MWSNSHQTTQRYGLTMDSLTHNPTVAGRHLLSLKELDVVLHDGYDKILFAISTCRNLETVTVTFERDTTVPAEGLLSLTQNCIRLRVLNLGCFGSTKGDGRSITDCTIEQVATSLPSLTAFRLGIQMELSIRALRCLGNLCTKLTACQLHGEFNLKQLWRPN